MIGFMKNCAEHLWIWAKNNRWLLAVLLLSLILRLVFISLFTHWDEGEMMDSNRYQQVASNIIRNRGFSEWGLPTAFSPPLYSFFIAGIMKIFGVASIPVKIVQVIISVLTCLCLYWIGKTVFNPQAGLIAALFLAVNPEMIVLAGSLYTETLYIFVSCAALAALIFAIRYPRGSRIWMLAGVLMGLAVLTRHILLLFPVLLSIFAWAFPSLRNLRKPLALFNLICYLLLLPWVVRNYVLFEQIVPVASGGGGGLYHGSNQSFEGHYQYELSRKVIAKETAGLENPLDKDRTLLRKSLHSIGEAPFQFSMLAIKKFIRFFTQVYEDIPRGGQRDTNPAVLIVLMLSYYPILMGCILGVIRERRQWRILFPLHLVILYSGCIYAMMLVTPRYRIPLYPFMILFLSAWLVPFLKKQRLKRDHDETGMSDRRESSS